MAKNRDRSFLSWLFFQDPAPKKGRKKEKSSAVPPIQDNSQESENWVRLFVKCENREDYITINEFPAIIGRVNTPETAVVIENNSISRHHATINCNNGLFSVVDVGSKNGIKLLGERLTLGQEFPLNRGDMLTLGKAEIRVEDLSEEESAFGSYHTDQVFSDVAQTDYIQLGSQSADFFASTPPHSPKQPQSISSTSAYNCARCGFNNDGSMNFCVKCGTPSKKPAPTSSQKRFCGHCGTKNTITAMFCGGCGSVLA